MRILVEPSDYTLFNVGDIAMLQAATERLAALWPRARIHVLTDVPDALSIACPDVVPLPRAGRQVWLADGCLLGRLYQHLPAFAAGQLSSCERSIRRRWPLLFGTLLQWKMRLRGSDSRFLTQFLEAMSQADLVIVAGMGGITDCFQEFALELLDVLECAIRLGKPTAMLGQGIGPVQNARLRARARQVLPLVDLICLRERRAGSPVLASLGVSPDRVMITGDDAIEMAYRARPEHLGGGLGVNLRIGWYSEVGDALLERIRPVIQQAACTRRAPLVPVPISRTLGEDDLLTFQKLASGYSEIAHDGGELDTPLKVIEQIHHCRIVVTGSYHAAVFALAQGIPTIGLASSAYYVDKFEGLAELFGSGSHVIRLCDDQWQEALATAIGSAWQSAEQVSPRLLEAAARQIALSHQGYERLHALVGTADMIALDRGAASAISMSSRPPIASNVAGPRSDR